MREKEYTNAIGQIKQAILKSQYQAAKGVNAIQLSLYYGIGRYVSENTGKKVWGTGALEAISAGLQGELPGLRGFSSANMKKMRIFYDQWHEFIESSPLADQLPMEEFLSVGFSHHMEILHKTTTVEERLFYVHQSYAHRWDKYVLRDMLRADIFHHQGALPNNFLKAMPSKHDAMFAVSMFRDEYFLDFLNLDDINAEDIGDVDERVVEKAIVKDIKNSLSASALHFVSSATSIAWRSAAMSFLSTCFSTTVI